MNHKRKLTDMRYQIPPDLSPDAKRDLADIRQIADTQRASNAYRKFIEKYYREIRQREEVCNQNISNFRDLLSKLDTHDQLIRPILTEYTHYHGFYYRDGKWTCNLSKALELMGDYAATEAVA